MRKAYLKTREQSEELTNSEHEPAEDRVLNEAVFNAEETAAAGADTARTGAEKVVRSTRKRIRIRDSVYSESSAGGKVRTRETALQTAGRTLAASKTAERTNAATQKAANDSRKIAQIAKQTAEKAKESAKAAYMALKAAIKGAIEGAKSLVAAIAAGGWVAVLIIIIVCLVGLIAASAFGIFAGNDVSEVTDGDTNRDLRTALSTINGEYYLRIEAIRNSVENLDRTAITINGEVGAMTGVWQDVLSVYAVDTAHGEDAVIAIDFDTAKTQRLRDIFWSMVSISYVVTERVAEEEQEITDESGVVTTELVEVTYRDVSISVRTKSAEQAAAMYSFTGEQNSILTELMSDRFTKSWSDLIYGYSYGDEDIVAVAISQIGNVGGEPYWRWYGLSCRTEWCAIFVSWCADQCGYIDSGIIPKFAWVPDAVSWFEARGQWRSGGYTPVPGDIIFFDWDGDGRANHVGIVEHVENGVVHTVEGNSGDACRRKMYSINSSSILGYGLPMY